MKRRGMIAAFFYAVASGQINRSSQLSNNALWVRFERGCKKYLPRPPQKDGLVAIAGCEEEGDEPSITFEWENRKITMTATEIMDALGSK